MGGIADRLEELVQRLLCEDEHAAYKTALEIARLGRPVMARVMELTWDPRREARAMACYILGQMGRKVPGNLMLDRYPDGIPVLLRRLESDPDVDVRHSAAAALGHLNVACTLPALCRAARLHSSAIRFSVAFALGGTWDDERQGAEGRRHRPEVIRTLLRLMEDEDDEVRDWATFGMHLGEHDTPEVRAAFWRAMDDPFCNVRAEAALGLALLGDRKLIPYLEPILREEDECQEEHFEAAKELGDPCLLPAVVAGAEHWRTFLKEGQELPWQVTAAIEALQQAADASGDPGVASRTPESPGLDRLPSLIERLLGEDEQTRYRAGRQVARMGRSVLPIVLAWAADTRPRMRAMACYILGEMGGIPTAAVALEGYADPLSILLERLERDADEDVRASAAWALDPIAATAALPALCRAASDPSVEVRYYVARALGGTFDEEWRGEEGRRYRPEVIRTLLRLMDDESERVRDWATFSMQFGEHDTPEVRAAFWKALEDLSSDVRAQAAYGLARLRDPALLPRLERLLREEDVCQAPYFEAAEALGDASLLDAVLAGADAWRRRLKPGETLPSEVTDAIEALQPHAAPAVE